MIFKLTHIDQIENLTRGKLFADNSFLCNCVEMTQTELSEGIYRIGIVEDTIQHRRHLAIVPSDYEFGDSTPCVIAIIQPGSMYRPYTICIPTDDYLRLYDAVKSCHERNETVTLFINNINF